MTLTTVVTCRGPILQVHPVLGNRTGLPWYRHGWLIDFSTQLTFTLNSFKCLSFLLASTPANSLKLGKFSLAKLWKPHLQLMALLIWWPFHENYSVWGTNNPGTLFFVRSRLFYLLFFLNSLNNTKVIIKVKKNTHTHMGCEGCESLQVFVVIN